MWGTWPRRVVTALLRHCYGVARVLVPWTSLIYPLYNPCTSLIHGFSSRADFVNATVSSPGRCLLLTASALPLFKWLLLGGLCPRRLGQLGQLAAAHAVAEIDHHADHEPDDQPPPSRVAQKGHQQECGNGAGGRDDPYGRGGESRSEERRVG